MKNYWLTLLVFTLIVSCSNESETNEIADTVPPVISISIAGYSNENTNEVIVVSNQIEVIINAEVPNEIGKIEAFLDNQKVGVDTSAPFSIVIDVSTYTSKTGKTADYKDYILKVEATDKAGNISSVEKTINIDNEIPSISNVSILQGSVISGKTNILTFSVEDNQIVSSVSFYLNEILVSTTTNEEYELYIDSTILDDGENVLRIEATDDANNIGVYILPFISDNTGPEINLESLVSNQILDELVSLEPLISDTYSNVESVEILYGETLLVQFDNSSTAYNINFDPNDYPVGHGVLNIRAFDVLGNLSQFTLEVEILRLIINVIIPDGYLSPNITINHFLIASRADGSLIDYEEVIFETREVKLHASEDFDHENSFTLTFASLGRNGVASYLYSIGDLTISETNEFILEVPKRFGGSLVTELTKTGFSNETQLSSFGRDYYFSSSEAGNTLIRDFTPTNHNLRAESIYIYGFNPLNNYYNYTFVNRPVHEDFTMNFDDFRTDNLEIKEFTTSSVDFLNNNQKTLRVYGFMNNTELDNNLFHQIWSYGYGQYMAINSFNYTVNNNFLEYAHDLTIGNYHSEGLGLPNEIIEIPNWTIDYTFENKQVSLIKSGEGYSVGEIFFDGGYDIGVPYQWNLVFDSTKNDAIVLPEIPSELQSFPIYDVYQNDNLNLYRVSLLRYNGMSNYSDYFNEVLKKNKGFNKAIPHFESIFIGESYQHFGSPGYLYNWW